MSFKVLSSLSQDVREKKDRNEEMNEMGLLLERNHAMMKPNLSEKNKEGIMQCKLGFEK